MSITSGRKLKSFFALGLFPVVFAFVIPFINGCVIAFLSQFISNDISNRFNFAILSASASYMAVLVAMKV